MIDIKINLQKDLEKEGFFIKDVLENTRQYFYQILQETQENKKSIFDLVQVLSNNNLALFIKFIFEDRESIHRIKNQKNYYLDNIFKTIAIENQKEIGIVKNLNNLYIKDLVYLINLLNCKFEFHFKVLNKTKIKQNRKSSFFEKIEKNFTGNIQKTLDELNQRNLKLVLQISFESIFFEKEIKNHNDIAEIIILFYKTRYNLEKEIHINKIDMNTQKYIKKLKKGIGTFLPLKNIDGEVKIKIK